MKNTLGLAALAALLASTAAHANFVVGTPADRPALAAATGQTLNMLEDFEHPAMGLNVSVPSFAQQGVSYATIQGAPLVVEATGGFNFAPAFRPLPSSVLTANGPDVFSVSFASPTAAVLLDVYTNGLGPATLSFRDDGGGAHAVTLDGPGGGATLASVAYWVPGQLITGIEFRGIQGEVINGGIDNLAWVSAVPEPAPLGLLAGGLALVGWRRRAACQRDAAGCRSPLA